MEFTKNEDRGGAIVRLLFLAVLVMVGLSYMARVVMESPRTSPESYAISSMRTVVTSQFTYSKTIGRGTYTVSNGSGNTTFAIYARPITYDEPTNHNSRRSSTRSFYTDQTGVIRYTAEDRPATVDDTPLGH